MANNELYGLYISLATDAEILKRLKVTQDLVFCHEYQPGVFNLFHGATNGLSGKSAANGPLAIVPSSIEKGSAAQFEEEC